MRLLRQLRFLDYCFLPLIPMGSWATYAGMGFFFQNIPVINCVMAIYMVCGIIYATLRFSQIQRREEKQKDVESTDPK